MARASFICFVAGVLSRLHGFRSAVVDESMLSHNSGLQKKEANVGSLFPGELDGGVRHASWNPYPISCPISDQNLWFSLPYFRPDQKFDTLFQTWSPGARRVTSCYGTYTVGVNIKREIVLSPNDEEVASSKKHTQFKTRVHKPYHISDQNGQNWCFFSDQNCLIA